MSLIKKTAIGILVSIVVTAIFKLIGNFINKEKIKSYQEKINKLNNTLGK